MGPLAGEISILVSLDQYTYIVKEMKRNDCLYGDKVSY